MNFNLQKSHLFFNMISFGINALSGLLLNIFIVRFYGISILGLFNQCLALYFIVSQISTFGIHFSALSYIPIENKKSQVFISALLLTLAISLCIGVLSYVILNYFLNYFEFFLLVKSLVFLIPAVVLFSINKVMIFSLNGIGAFHRFAIANGLRLFLMLIGVFIHKAWELDFEKISVIILFSEALLLLILFIMTSFLFNLKEGLNLKFWFKKHFLYGKYAVFSGLIIDLNMKIDILVLSFFVSKSTIGIYSFAAMLGEGFYQLISVFKNLNSKNLSLYLHQDKKIKKVHEQKELNYMTYFCYFIGFLSLVFYKPFTKIVTENDKIVDLGFWIYLIYLFSLLISCRYIILDNFLLLLNTPEIDNKVRSGALLINFILCILLSIFFGMYGAVMALGTSIVFNAFAIKFHINKFYKKLLL